MEPLPRFPFFADPIREKVITPSTEMCDICHQKRGFAYAGPTYGASRPMNVKTICPWCISDGSAADLGFQFNDIGAPETYGTPTMMIEEDCRQVEGRTPGFVTWQGNHWILCCGRACVYVGEADSADLRGRWRDAVPSMFRDQSGLTESDKEEIISSIRRGGSPSAFVFQCQVCEQFRAYWDQD